MGSNNSRIALLEASNAAKDSMLCIEKSATATSTAATNAVLKCQVHQDTALNAVLTANRSEHEILQAQVIGLQLRVLGKTVRTVIYMGVGGSLLWKFMRMEEGEELIRMIGRKLAGYGIEERKEVKKNGKKVEREEKSKIDLEGAEDEKAKNMPSNQITVGMPPVKPDFRFQEANLEWENPKLQSFGRGFEELL